MPQARGKVVAFKPGGTPGPDMPKGMEISEPVHRIPPEGAGSGLSVRDQPTSCVDQVKKICMHYVSKCSGKYGNSPVSARYVHQMATEILTQLKGVAMQIKQQENNPEILQELLDEWNDQFPPSLGDLGTPKHIAATIQRQAKEVGELKAQLSDEIKKREKDVNSVLRSMDAQLSASRDSVMTERRQHSLAHTHQLNQLKAQLKEAQRLHKHEVKALTKSSAADLQAQQQRYMDKINRLDGEAAEKRASLEVELAETKGKLAALETSSKEKEASMRRTIKKMQLDIAHNNKHQSRLARRARVDGRSVGTFSLSMGDEGGLDASIAGTHVSGDDGTAVSGLRSSVKSTKSRASTMEEEEAEMDDDISDVSSVLSIPIVKPSSGNETERLTSGAPVVRQRNVRVRGSAAMGAIKILKRELKEAMRKVLEKEEEMGQLRTDLAKYISDYQYQRKRADGLDSINESLRQAVSKASGHHEHYEPHPVRGSVLRFAPQPVKHTPHFLGGYS